MTTLAEAREAVGNMILEIDGSILHAGLDKQTKADFRKTLKGLRHAADLLAGLEWLPIGDDLSPEENVLLYFPATKPKNGFSFPPMQRFGCVNEYPRRKPTMFLRVPTPPAAGG